VALVDAAREALTNVTKHARVAEATMHAYCTSYSLTVSVLDHGAGFDPARTPTGMGLRESITRRLADAGGTATVQSTPGEGTYVELTVPLSGGSPGETRTRSDEG
jgi:signal transduction histidine kinase